MRVRLIREELVVRADGVASGVVHLGDIDRARGLALLQAVLVVLDVGEGQGQEDDHEEQADAAHRDEGAGVVFLFLPGEANRTSVHDRHVARREERRRMVE